MSQERAPGSHPSIVRDLFRSKLFLTLAAIAGVLLVAIARALIFTSTKFQDSLYKPGGGLLDGLIANGISVVVSTILIAPLTAYFVVLRRERQLAPVRKGFVMSIASGVDRIAEFYIHRYQIYGRSVIELQNKALQNTLKQAQEALLETCKQVTAEMLEEQRSPRLIDSSLAKTIKDAMLIKSTITDLYDLLYKETASVETTLMFALPLFPVEVVSDLHEIRQKLIDYRGSLQAMLGVISGEDDLRIIAEAKNSALDFENIFDRLKVISKAASFNDFAALMKNVDSFVTVLPVYTQRKISEALVDVFESLRPHRHL